MYVITYKGKPATLGKIYAVEGATGRYMLSEYQRYGFIAAPSARAAKAHFLNHIGFTWKERAEGIEVQKVEVAK